MKSRLISMVTAVVITIILGIVTRSRETLLLAVPLLCYVFASRIALPSPPRISARRFLSSQRLEAGDTLGISLEVDVSPAQPTLLPAEHFLVVADNLPHGMGPEWPAIRGILPLRNENTLISMTYDCRPRRGIHRPAGLHLWTSDPGGLWPIHRFIAAPGRVAVFPRLRVRTGLTLRPKRTLLFGGSIPAGEGGAGLHFFDVRDYRPGDSLRHINWKASARRPKRPVINEFEPERATDVGLILDARESVWKDEQNSGTRFDAAVRGVAGLVDLLLDLGNRLSLLVYGGTIDWLPPGSGRIQRERALTRLAAATPRDHLVFSDMGRIPLHLFPPGSQLVIVGPARLEDIPRFAPIVSRGYHVLILEPVTNADESHDEPAGSGGSYATRNHQLASRLKTVERSVVRKRLGRYGITLIRWNIDEPLAVCLARENRRLARMRSPGRFRRWT